MKVLDLLGFARDILEGGGDVSYLVSPLTSAPSVIGQKARASRWRLPARNTSLM